MLSGISACIHAQVLVTGLFDKLPANNNQAAPCMRAPTTQKDTPLPQKVVPCAWLVAEDYEH